MPLLLVLTACGGVEETVFPTGAVLRVTRGTQHDDDGRIEWVGGELTEAQSDWLRGIVTMRMPSSRVDEMVGHTRAAACRRLLAHRRVAHRA